MANSILDRDDYLTLTKAAGLVPPSGTHYMTLHRWSKGGLRGTRLKTVRISGARYTTPEWLEEFIIATQDEETRDALRQRRKPTKSLNELLERKPSNKSRET